MLQTGFGSGFPPIGSGLESDSKKLESEHLWYLLNDAIVLIADTTLRLPTEIFLKGMQREQGPWEE